ncbi:hypothetical protein BC835DRAFT_1315246 [Cytidiella melzeri]|nr:hypothetical protein BC835DRAFT_1315246 [Cytidiella melzeri]
MEEQGQEGEAGGSRTSYSTMPWLRLALKQKRKRGGFVDLLMRIFLLWFTIYTFSVCPNDEALKSPICRGLSAYRRYVLDPYVTPTVQRALAHPSIAPYVDRATPVILSGIDTAKPFFIRARSEWRRRVVPQWKKRVVPQWQNYVDPQLDNYVWPHFTNAKGLVTPYISNAQSAYERRLGPHLRFALQKLETWQYQARPYVILAAHKSYDGYQAAKPYAIPVLEQLQSFLLQLVQIFREQRRQFVDPHVQKIWERVKELSSGETKPIGAASKAFAASVSRASATASSLLSSALETSTLVPAASEAAVGSAFPVLPDPVTEKESLPSPFPSTNPTASLAGSDSVISPSQSVSAFASSVAQEAVSTVTVAASAASSLADDLGSSASSLTSIGSSIVAEDALPSASSLIQESVVTPVASVSEQVSASVVYAKNAATTALSHVSASFVDVASEASSTLSSVTDQLKTTVTSLASVIPTQLSAEDDSDEDLNLDNFWAEIGLDDLNTHMLDDSEEVAEPAGRREETEEEKAERLRLRKEYTIRKREDILARHSQWEAKMEAQISQAQQQLRKSLGSSRKAAATELKQSREIRDEIDSLVEDAEKYLKGAEKYLSNTLKDTRSGRSDEEKLAMWTRVVEKIDQKFEERIGQTEVLVNGWYDRVLAAEVAEVQMLSAEVQKIAGDAQGDIGLDYAWLDDVTYLDWQRYHDLERRVDNFTTLAMSIQDGTHPSPPANPILPILEDLQNEVQDVIVGFETRLRRVKRSGDRGFGAVLDELETDDVPSDETVSILPIEEEEKRLEDGESPAVPPVVIGRSKEEIASVLERIAEQEGQATSASGDKDVKPEQIALGLAQDVAEESNFAPPASKHEEL